MLILDKTNKRGDVSIVILVFLVLLVVFGSLFIFYTSSVKIKDKISGVVVFNKVYMQENSIKFYLDSAGKDVMVKTYKDFVDDSGDEYDYINNRRTVEGKYPEFEELHSKINEKFEKRFSENFKKEFEKYDFEEDYLIDLKKNISENKFDVSFNGEFIQLNMNSLMLTNSIKETSIIYKPQISLEFDLNKIGLDDFGKLYNVKEDCKKQEDIQECFNNRLNYFNAFVNQENSLVTLTSKKEFLIDEEFKKIEFSFIPK